MLLTILAFTAFKNLEPIGMRHALDEIVSLLRRRSRLEARSLYGTADISQGAYKGLRK
jgi:hypothetical protein